MPLSLIERMSSPRERGSSDLRKRQKLDPSTTWSDVDFELIADAVDAIIKLLKGAW